jgi:multiple sugar transport system substrate-binding protein
MSTARRSLRRRVLAAGALATAALLALTACSSSGTKKDNNSGNGGSGNGGSSSGASAAALDSNGYTKGVSAALAKGGDVTVWTWIPQIGDLVKAFEAKYPKVHVKVVNTGGATQQYTKLQNVLSAGSGIPDLAQVEYYALPQFALKKSLVDLTSFGVGAYKDKFISGVWDGAVALNGGIYGIPQDSGPMAYFYRADLFKKYGLTVPKTWDDFVADAKKLKAADPTAYIAPDSGDAGFTTSMIWQAGGQPYKVDGTKVTINFGDAGTKKWTSVWNQLVEGKLVDTKTAGWSDAWFKNFNNGTYLSVASGAWWPGILESSVKSGSGKWRVAPMPQYTAGDKATAANGGSSFALPKGGKNQLLALGFDEWMNTTADGIAIWSKGGAFPATQAQLTDSTWLNASLPYFGGQKANQVLADAANNVVKGWSYLPFQVYANSIYGDTVGKAYAANSDLTAGLAAWQKKSAEYGKSQGFDVSS